MLFEQVQYVRGSAVSLLIFNGFQYRLGFVSALNLVSFRLPLQSRCTERIHFAPRSGAGPEDELAATARSEALTQQLSDEAHKSNVPQIILVLGLKGAGAFVFLCDCARSFCGKEFSLRCDIRISDGRSLI